MNSKMFFPTMLPGSRGDPFSLWYLSPGEPDILDPFLAPGPPIIHVTWSTTTAPSSGQMRHNAWNTGALYGRSNLLVNLVGTPNAPLMLDHFTQFWVTIDPTILPDGYGGGFTHPISDAKGQFDPIVDGEEWDPGLAGLLPISVIGRAPYNRAHRFKLNFGLAVTRKEGVDGIYIPVVGQYTVVTISSAAPPSPVPPAVGSAPDVVPSGTTNVVVKYQGNTIWSIPVDPANIIIDTSEASNIDGAGYESWTAYPNPPFPFPNGAGVSGASVFADNGLVRLFYVTRYRYTGHVHVPLSDLGSPDMVLPGAPLPYGTTLDAPYNNPPLWNDFRASVSEGALDPYGAPTPLPIGVIPNTTPIGMGTEQLPPDSLVPCRDEQIIITATGSALWEQVNKPAWTQGINRAIHGASQSVIFTNPSDIGLTPNGIPVAATPTDPTAVLFLPPYYLFYQCSF